MAAEAAEAAEAVVAVVAVVVAKVAVKEEEPEEAEEAKLEVIKAEVKEVVKGAATEDLQVEAVHKTEEAEAEHLPEERQ